MMTADQIRSLQPAVAALLGRFRGCFKTQTRFGHWEKYLLGPMSDLKRKSIEPIALAAGVAVRTLQEFLAFFVWHHDRINNQLQQMAADERLRKKNPRITLAQVDEAANDLATVIWNRNWRAPAERARTAAYHQQRNEDSYESRRGKSERMKAG